MLIQSLSFLTSLSSMSRHRLTGRSWGQQWPGLRSTCWGHSFQILALLWCRAFSKACGSSAARTSSGLEAEAKAAGRRWPWLRMVRCYCLRGRLYVRGCDDPEGPPWLAGVPPWLARCSTQTEYEHRARRADPGSDSDRRFLYIDICSRSEGGLSPQ